jgi:hypothetical protein
MLKASLLAFAPNRSHVCRRDASRVRSSQSFGVGKATNKEALPNSGHSVPTPPRSFSGSSIKKDGIGSTLCRLAMKQRPLSQSTSQYSTE